MTSSGACFRCINNSCGEEFDSGLKLYQCPKCGDLLDLCIHTDLDPRDCKQLFRQRRARNEPLDSSGVWRFRELLPFSQTDLQHVVTLGEGNTPLLDAPLSARYAGLDRLRVKHLGWNPTGSFKDYGMTVAITQARKMKSRWVACASTGNTSSSMAAYCARTDLKAVVFIPEGQIAYGKLAQTLDYGALSIQIQGDFDTAMRLVLEISEKSDLYLMNSINPFRIEGQKTILFELFDQLDWQIPDRIVVPGGNLGNSGSLGKALIELKHLGFIEKIPRITIIQAQGAAPLHETLVSRSEHLRYVESPETRATAIKIGNPVNWKKAVRALEFSDGWCDSVSEQEIADAKAVLGRDGIGCEPASATTVAGLRKLIQSPGAPEDGSVGAGEDVVAILTGHQLKDSEYTVDYHLDRLQRHAGKADSESAKLQSNFANQPHRIAADSRDILEFLGLESEGS